MENSLRGEVFKKFPSISSFAKVLGWDRKKASRIVNRVQKPSVNDIEQMAECLNVTDPKLFMEIFLPSIPTMWENN